MPLVPYPAPKLNMPLCQSSHCSWIIRTLGSRLEGPSMKKTEKTCPRVIRKSSQQLVRLSMCSQSTFRVLPNLSLTTTPWGRYRYLPPFTDVETEGQVFNCLLSHTANEWWDGIWIQTIQSEIRSCWISVILSKLSTRFVECQSTTKNRGNTYIE